MIATCKAGPAPPPVLDGATCGRCGAVTGPYLQALVGGLVDAMKDAGLLEAFDPPFGRWCVKCTGDALDTEVDLLLVLGQVPVGVAWTLWGKE